MKDVFEFGRELLETNDLDPVYVVLHEAKLEQPTLLRWLLAYWGFYHVGTASWIAETDYWSRFETAAGSKEYPRSSERRHYRGENARKSVEFLRSRGVLALFAPILATHGLTLRLRTVLDYVQTWVGFGPWIAFKVADMIERLGLAAIQFDNGAAFLFDSPREGASLMWETERDGPIPTSVNEWAVATILERLGRFRAPPRHERAINVQEAETILCKWKAYRSGHYEVGEDITAVRNGLLRFARCKTAQRLLAAGKGRLW